MPEVMMIRSMLNQHVIDIENNSTTKGAGLDANQAKSGTVPVLNSGGPPPQIAANQSWFVQPDPNGSEHVFIQNPATGHVIDIEGNSQSPGARLDAFTFKSSDNQNQLWDFLPDPFGSGGFFIQNPQTGFVIEIENGSDTPGAALVVNPRRLFDSNRQLWSGMLAGGAGAEGLPLLTIAPPPPKVATLEGSQQYVLLPTNQTQNLTGVTVTLDIIEDLVTESFSVQINGNPPYPPPNYHPQPGQTPYFWDARWMQFGLVMANNNLVLFQQVWPPRGKENHPPGDPLESKETTSSPILGLKNNTIPAGTRIVLTLDTDKNNNDFLTSISGKVFNGSGAQIGTPVTWSAIGQPTFIGPTVQESNLAPLGAFQVVIVGPPSGTAHFTAGLGTITVVSAPDISASQGPWPDPQGDATGETSNMFYGKVQSGFHHHLAQPFGVPSPKITPQDALYSFSGTGLYPNSNLTAKAEFTLLEGAPVAGVFELLSANAAPDGSFSLIVTPADTSVIYKTGTSLAVTVTDAFGNWAGGQCVVAGWPKGWVPASGTATKNS
jgi:hypothetical protein